LRTSLERIQCKNVIVLYRLVIRYLCLVVIPFFAPTLG
jgi:hypothetical protein